MGSKLGFGSELGLVFGFRVGSWVLVSLGFGFKVGIWVWVQNWVLGSDLGFGFGFIARFRV